MTFARLLAAILVLCCLSALAQDRKPRATASSTPACGEFWTGCPVQGNISGLVTKTFFFLDSTTLATVSLPSRLTSNTTSDVRSGYNALDPVGLPQVHFDQVKGDPRLRLKMETLDADLTCYTIRTYVVARDSKDSDSTHPAGYSTCQPSAQYQLKTTVLRSGSQDR